MRLSGIALVIMLASFAGACTNAGQTATSPSGVAPSDPVGNDANPPAYRGPAPPSRPNPPASATCNAASAQWAIGRLATGDLLESARNAAQAASARFIRPNEPITMEFLDSRLNLGLDRRDIVASVNCG
jgi:hypothetical protein